MYNYESVFTENELKSIAKEFERLKDKTYLDHAGATLYSDSQIRNVLKDLTDNLYLNPHTSKHTADSVDQVRYQVLSHFNTNANEYSIIFTSGATQALKLVAESFTYFDTKSQEANTEENGSNKGAFIYLQDNHTSVLGMREIAAKRSARVICVPHKEMMKQINCHKTQTSNIMRHDTAEKALFVYPAQCNFSGYKYPLNWSDFVKGGALDSYIHNEYGKSISKLAVLVDTSAFVSTNKLDLTLYKPDFVCLSFYKIFGYPTGLGALLVRNNSEHFLDSKMYYGGGTVEIAMSGIDFHVKRANLHDRFEDGTISFLSILALKHGFAVMNRLIKNSINTNMMDRISQHTFHLSQYVYRHLTDLKHFNGYPVARVYCDSAFNDITIQGGIINFNLLRSNGEFIGFAEVVHMTELFNIYLRSGCFCNPGACQRFLNLSNEDLRKHYKAGHVCGDNNDLIDGVPTGSLRVSFGYMSTIEDARTLIDVIVKCFVDRDPCTYPISEMNHLALQHSSIYKDRKDIIIKHNTETVNICDDINLIPKGTLKEIHLYPLKSCGAFKVTKWEVGPKGLKYDREWMIVTENGQALTQKQDTRMCIIQPSINLEANELKLSFPGVENVTISLSEIVHKIENQNTICNSKVCGEKINGVDCGDEVSDWLVDVLGWPGIRLIRQSMEEQRFFKKSSEHDAKLISLSNQAQYLAINTASVKWLASKVETQEFNERIDNLTARFRGNLIMEATTEFEEFSWKKIKIGSVIFQAEGPCTRCQMVCIDQESGEKTVEPLRTISKEFQGKINFGVYLSQVQSIKNEIYFLSKGDNIYEVSI